MFSITDLLLLFYIYIYFFCGGWGNLFYLLNKTCFVKALSLLCAEIWTGYNSGRGFSGVEFNMCRHFDWLRHSKTDYDR